jgi:hypothetical protein
MRPEGQKKLSICDDDGAEVAYTLGGVVYDVPNGQQIANLRSGKLYAVDGQLLGILTPSERFAVSDGKPAADFLRLLIVRDGKG